MFNLDELHDCYKVESFQTDLAWFRQVCSLYRLRLDYSLDKEKLSRLLYFADAVFESVCELGPSEDKFIDMVSTCAQILDFGTQADLPDDQLKTEFKRKAILLYESIGLTGVSRALSNLGDYGSALSQFFKREGLFSSLQMNPQIDGAAAERAAETCADPFERALSADVFHLGSFEQTQLNGSVSRIANQLLSASSAVGFRWTRAEIKMLSRLLDERKKASVAFNSGEDLFNILKRINFSTELWPAQAEAVRSGLLKPQIRSFGFASPTGTGKSFLAQLAIADLIERDPEAKVIYLVPSKALVNEVTAKLQHTFSKVDIGVMQVTPNIVPMSEEEEDNLDSCSVVVMTPEKADLILRLRHSFMDEVRLVIVDEAHHIESDSRGILLELYLWRMKRLLSSSVKFVFLSAVSPNINELASWIAPASTSVTRANRATTMHVGVYKIKRGTTHAKQGWIDYTDGSSACVVDKRVEPTLKAQLVQLAHAVKTGPVLVVAKGKKECENLAKVMCRWLIENGHGKKLGKEELLSDLIQRLDSRLEREMYPEVPLRELLEHRIAYHHAGLPPRVRFAVEEAIRKNMVDFVFATTTLAEGVNFPFSTVIVQSLALRDQPQKGVPVRYHPVTPRTFWNIAGRAGRPGYDKEGQVILFEPSLGLKNIQYVLGDYLNADLRAVHPVKSALAKSLDEIADALKSGDILEEHYKSAVLEKSLPKRIQGAINLVRVGLCHAKASKINGEPETLFSDSLAFRHIKPQNKKIAQKFIRDQMEVVSIFEAESPDEGRSNLVAELGLSIETLTEFQHYIKNIEDWQIESFDKVVLRGEINFERVSYVIGPVAKRMAELDGGSLGGFLSDVIVQWLAGVPLSSVHRKSNYRDRLEDLISVIYSRVQFLLPWGLYAFDRLVEVEAGKRGLSYQGTIRQLAYLSDAGVPSLDAYRLISLDIERVDAARLAAAFRSEGGIRSGVDVVGWVLGKEFSSLKKLVAGSDKRRIDYDLEHLIANLKYQLVSQ